MNSIAVPQIQEPSGGQGSTANPAPNFNRLARAYRWMEWASFGPFLHWCRCAYLAQMRGCRRALVIGDGDGRFTARLLKANRGVQVDAVDAGDVMLRALLRRAGGNAPRVQVECRDARRWRAADRSYDLIVTHFFLDCLTTAEVRTLAEQVRAAAAHQAMWAVSEFQVPRGWLGALVAGPLVSFLYWAFGRMTGLAVRRLPDYRSALKDSGFAPIKQKSWLGGVLISELWQPTHAPSRSEPLTGR